MIIVCQKCDARLQVDEAKVPAGRFTIRCPKCNSSYTDESLLYCVSDGTELVAAGGQTSDTNATMLYPQARRTARTATR